MLSPEPPRLPGYEWTEAGGLRLVRTLRYSPPRSRQPFLLATAAVGAGFIWASVWGTDTLRGVATYLGTLALAGFSGIAVGRPADPRRRHVLREVVLGAPSGAYRTGPVGGAVVDGEDVGSPIAVARVRWVSPTSKGSSLVKYEVSLVTALGVFILTSTVDADLDPFATRLKTALGDRVKLLEAHAQLPEVNFFAWTLAAFTVAVAAMPMAMSPARHGLVAVAGVALVLLAVVSGRTWLLARSTRDMRRIYRLPGGPPTGVTRRWWVALSLVAVALFWGALLWPGGPGLTTSGAPDESGFIPVWLAVLGVIVQLWLVARPCVGGPEGDALN